MDYSKVNGIILTEGGHGVGLGHITRCSSLFRMFQKNLITLDFLVEYSGTTPPDAEFIVSNWRSKKIFGYDLVIIDSYLADLEQYKQLASSNSLILVIDDFNRLEYPDCILLNGSILAENISYCKNRNTFLLGTQYIPLREPFWENSVFQVQDVISQVLLIFGSEDRFGLIPRVVDVLKDLNLKFHCVLGASNSYQNEFQQNPGANIVVHNNINGSQMKTLMQNVDLCISAGGQTTYELASVGTPAIIIGIAENQAVNIANWKRVGFTRQELWESDELFGQRLLNEFNYMSLETRKQVSTIGQKYVDGQGAYRVFEAVMKRLG